LLLPPIKPLTFAVAFIRLGWNWENRELLRRKNKPLSYVVPLALLYCTDGLCSIPTGRCWIDSGARGTVTDRATDEGTSFQVLLKIKKPLKNMKKKHKR